MELSQEQAEILYRAYVLSKAGCGQVIENWAYPAAHELAEHGWLERRFEPDDELSWWWTPAAEMALDTSRLIASITGASNN